MSKRTSVSDQQLCFDWQVQCEEHRACLERSPAEPERNGAESRQKPESVLSLDQLTVPLVLPASLPELRQALCAWGKKLGYPAFDFTGKVNGFLGRGEYSWRYTLLYQQEATWFESALAWLEAGNKVDPPSPIHIGETAFLEKIRRGRSDMLLMYAGKKGYPEVQIQVDGLEYTFEQGKEAWQEAAYSVEIEICETALTLLAEVRFTPQDITEMEEWLRVWGKANTYPSFSFPFHYPSRNENIDRRYGTISAGEERWQIEMRYPYGLFGSYETYPGEWLEKCIAQCKRFDAREQEIPWQMTREQEERRKKSVAGFEEEEEDE